MNVKEHLLVCLMEECAEIQYAAAKALRFGMDDKYQDGPTNRESLHHELQDLIATVDALVEAEVFAGEPLFRSQALINRKRKRLTEFMEYAKLHGTLSDAEIKS